MTLMRQASIILSKNDLKESELRSKHTESAPFTPDCGHFDTLYGSKSILSFQM